MAELDLNCVASFVALVEHSNYARAAADLYITSSALTKHIRRLENQLGISLIVRDNSGAVGMTPAGHRFATHAGPLLAQARAARRAASEQPSFTVRVGLAGVVGEHPTRLDLVALGRELRRLHPGGTLSCRGFPIEHLEAALLDNRVDFIIAPRCEGLLNAHSLTDLWDLKRVAVFNDHHKKLAGLSQIDAKDLCEFPILYDPAIPAHWMELFCLGDVRPLSDALLVGIRAPKAANVFSEARKAEAVAISQEGHLPVGSGLRVIDILNAPPVRFVAARRPLDNRECVTAVIDMMRSLHRSS